MLGGEEFLEAEYHRQLMFLEERGDIGKAFENEKYLKGLPWPIPSDLVESSRHSQSNSQTAQYLLTTTHSNHHNVLQGHRPRPHGRHPPLPRGGRPVKPHLQGRRVPPQERHRGGQHPGRPAVLLGPVAELPGHEHLGRHLRRPV